MDWRRENGCGIEEITENQILVFFEEEVRKGFAPTSLWTTYSMLKEKIYHQHNIDISKFKKVLSLIKQANVGYKPKKSKSFHLRT